MMSCLRRALPFHRLITQHTPNLRRWCLTHNPSPSSSSSFSSSFSSSSSPSSSSSLSPTLVPQRPISQPTNFTHPGLLSPSEVTPAISRNEYISRRRKLSPLLPPNSLSILLPNPQHYMSEDVPYPYHPNTDLFYLCGVQEPDAILLIHRDDSNSNQTTFTLALQRRDPPRELWDGPRCGATSDVRDYFGVDSVIPLSKVPDVVADLLPQLTSLHVDPRVNYPVLRSVLSRVLEDDKLKNVKDKNVKTLDKIWRRDATPKQFLLPLRLRKSDAEISLMRQAARATATALNAAMHANDTHESHIDARLIMECTRHGASRMAFPSVVASGNNATVLHYMRKDAPIRHGELVMVDTGCEVHGYCSDVSRTWPVNGKFSSPQRDMYALVLDAHTQCVERAVIGQSLDAIHSHAALVLTEGLRHLGFLKGHSTESALSTGVYAKYFPHAIGHFLGCDVHDTHAVHKSIPLEKNMVITIEPGLYCPVDDEHAPSHFHGIGMRLEDDVVVGNHNIPPDVLSSDAVKDIDDIEHLVSSGR